MAGGVGHTGGLTNPRPWRGRCQAGYSNTGGPPLPRKRAPLQKKKKQKKDPGPNHRLGIGWLVLFLRACILGSNQKRGAQYRIYESWVAQKLIN